MAKKEIVIPNLVPGKRYRMVVETPPTTGEPSLLAPSVEFVVPSAPRLISTYTPTFSVISEPWSVTTTTTTTVPGTWVEVGSVQAQTTYTYNYSSTLGAQSGLGGWSYTLNSWNYTFYTNVALTNLQVNQVVTITNFGDTYDGNFTVTGVYSGTWTIKNSSGVAQTFNKAITATSHRRAGHQTATTSNNGNITYTIPNVPSVRYQNPDTTTTTTTVSSGTYYHVDVNIPSEIQKDLMSTSTVKKIPVFFYIQNGVYYYFDGSVVGNTPLTLTTTPVIEMKKRNLNANSSVSARDYRFTVAKYTLIGSSWYGDWEQKLDTYQSIGPSFSRVVISQPGVRI